MTTKHRVPKVPFVTNSRLGAHSSFSMRKKESKIITEAKQPNNEKKNVSITTTASDGFSQNKNVISNSSEFTSIEYDEEKSNFYLTKESDQSLSYISDISEETESSLINNNSQFILSPDSSPQQKPPPTQLIPENDFDFDIKMTNEFDEYYKNSIYVLNEDEESSEYADKLTEFDINDLWFDSVAHEIFDKDYPEFLLKLHDEVDSKSYLSSLALNMANSITKDEETNELIKENPVNASFKAAVKSQRNKALSDDDYDREMANLSKFNSKNFSPEELNQQWGFKNPEIGKYIAKYRKQLFIPT